MARTKNTVAPAKPAGAAKRGPGRPPKAGGSAASAKVAPRKVSKPVKAKPSKKGSRGVKAAKSKETSGGLPKLPAELPDKPSATLLNKLTEFALKVNHVYAFHTGFWFKHAGDAEAAKEGKSDEWIDVAAESDAYQFACALSLFPDEYAKYVAEATKAYIAAHPAPAEAPAEAPAAAPPPTAATPGGKPIDKMSKDELDELMAQLESRRAAIPEAGGPE